MDEKLSLDRLKEWMDTVGYEFRKCSVCGVYERNVVLFPAKVEIPVITWDVECYACGEKTPVVWVDDNECKVSHTYTITPYTFQDLENKIAQKYSFFKVVEKLTQGITQHGNVCVHCGAYQGDWYITEDLLEICVGGGKFLIKTEMIEIDVSEEERFVNANTVSNVKLLNRTIDKENNVKMLLCNECNRKRKKK